MSRFYKQEAKEKNIIMEVLPFTIIMEVLPFTTPKIHDITFISDSFEKL